ncbi:MAG: hypothetical protein AB7E36_12015 [Salinivirgaceae bacterium]
MPYNLLILPLSGGFLFLYFFAKTKYFFQRLGSQELIFFSVIAGISLITLSVLLKGLILFCFPEILTCINEFHDYMHFSHIPLLWTAFFSLILAVFITHVGNKIIQKVDKEMEYSIISAIMHVGSRFEKLAATCFITGEMMQITLNNNKVYIGFIDTLPPPKKDEYFSLIPVFSGYRDRYTRNLTITSNYLKVIDRYQETDETKKDKFDLDIFIKSDEIISASLFDYDVYEVINNETNGVDNYFTY